jgi:hypothetical protein
VEPVRRRSRPIFTDRQRRSPPARAAAYVLYGCMAVVAVVTVVMLATGGW